MKEVLIADDHPVFRAGLRQLIEKTGDYKVIAESNDGASCITSIRLTNPDIVVLDLSMPTLGGYDVLEWVSKNKICLACIIISMYSSQAHASKAKRLGATAFIAKEDATTEIHDALLTQVGNFYVSASVGGVTSKPIVPIANAALWDGTDSNLLENLSPAELRVFNLVSQNMTSREIGRTLNLSHRTIQTHRHNISKKLKLEGANSLLHFALKYQTNRKTRNGNSND